MGRHEVNREVRKQVPKLVWEPIEQPTGLKVWEDENHHGIFAFVDLVELGRKMAEVLGS